MSAELSQGDASWPDAAFEALAPGNAPISVVAHVPHASTVIPDSVRAEFLVDDAELAQEVMRMTDWFTDDLFAPLGKRGVTRFVNRLSRFVFDPERFLDDTDEATAARGMGVVYTHGTQGQRLREDSAARRSARIKALYRPYHAALDTTVGELLERFGTCTLIDCHSFPAVPLPNEIDQAPGRPEICLGTDAIHTPAPLADALEASLRKQGFVVERNTPYAGTFVPGGYFGREPRVRSVMIEVRRDLYIDETTATRNDRYEETRDRIEQAIRSADLV